MAEDGESGSGTGHGRDTTLAAQARRFLENPAALGSLAALLVLLAAAWSSIWWSGIQDGATLPAARCDAVVGSEIARWLGGSGPASGHGVHGTLGAREYGARITLSWGMLLSLTTMGVVVVYCLALRVTEARRRREIPLAFLVAATAGIVMGTIASSFWDPDAFFFEAYSPLLRCLHHVVNHDAFALANAANGLLMVATGCLVGSVWQAVVDLPDECDRSMGDPDAKEYLRGANDRVVFHLYLGSALLVTSVVALHSYYSWPAAIVDETHRSSIKELALVVAVLFGSIYSLVLVFVLGPAILSLSSEALRVAREGFDQRSEAEARTWVADNGLRSTAFQQGVRILAALGPVLTGPVLQLVTG